MEFLSVKNFEKFQHYKDRNPPWIKLYQEFLSDYDVSKLSNDARLYLSFFYLLASRTANKIPSDPGWIKVECHCKTDPPIQELLKSGFIRKIKDKEKDASKDASNIDKTEIETEKSRVEKEIEKEGETLAPASPEPPSDFKIFQDFWAKEFLERTGEKYLWMGAKDSKLVKGMLGSLGLETLKERAIALFESQDEFILKAGKSIGVLHSCLNKLTSGGKEKPVEYFPKDWDKGMNND